MKQKNLLEALLEVVASGMPPEDAALLLLEPSRWDKDLFGPTGDLKAIYDSYTRGEIGIGRLFDAASDIASAADSMAEIADTVSRHYGDDTRPDDVPEDVDEEDRVPAEDETVEVLQVKDGQVSSKIIDSIRARFPVSLLEQVFPAPSGQPTDIQRLMQSFESGFVVDRAFRSVENIVSRILPEIRDAWSRRDWQTVAALYSQLQEDASGLAGDLMVMNQVADAAVTAGMGDSIIPSQSPHPLARREQLEAWMPAALGRAFEEFIAELHSMLSQANLGELSYADLKRITDQAIRPDSPVMSFVDADAERDLDVIRGLHLREVPPAAGEPEPAVPGVVAAEPAVAPEPAPTPAEPPAEPPDTISGIFGAEEVGTTEQDRQIFSDTLGIDDARAARLGDFLVSKQMDPTDLATKLDNALAGLSALGFFKSWQELQRRDLRRARMVQTALKGAVRDALEANREIEAAELLRDAITAVRGTPERAAGEPVAPVVEPAAGAAPAAPTAAGTDALRKLTGFSSDATAAVLGRLQGAGETVEGLVSKINRSLQAVDQQVTGGLRDFLRGPAGPRGRRNLKAALRVRIRSMLRTGYDPADEQGIVAALTGAVLREIPPEYRVAAAPGPD